MTIHIRIEPGGSLHISGGGPVSITRVRRNGGSVEMSVSAPGRTVTARRADGSVCAERVDDSDSGGLYFQQSPSPTT